MAKIGPGPGAYRLPTTTGFPGHDPTRTRAPAYTLGAAERGGYGSIGPGPTYKIERMTRDGFMSSPCWTLSSRMPLRQMTKAPGPGAHAPERCPPVTTKAPAYSMGARLNRDPVKIGPGPMAYSLRGKRDGPSWSLAARLTLDTKHHLSPGPAVYFQKEQNVFKNKPPVYSLGARLDVDRGPSKSPGPAAYPPHLYNIKKYNPAYSFGTKHADGAPPMIVTGDTMSCLS